MCCCQLFHHCWQWWDQRSNGLGMLYGQWESQITVSRGQRWNLRGICFQIYLKGEGELWSTLEEVQTSRYQREKYYELSSTTTSVFKIMKDIFVWFANLFMTLFITSVIIQCWVLTPYSELLYSGDEYIYIFTELKIPKPLTFEPFEPQKWQSTKNDSTLHQKSI